VDFSPSRGAHQGSVDHGVLDVGVTKPVLDEAKTIAGVIKQFHQGAEGVF